MLNWGKCPVTNIDYLHNRNWEILTITKCAHIHTYVTLSLLDSDLLLGLIPIKDRKSLNETN